MYVQQTRERFKDINEFKFEAMRNQVVVTNSLHKLRNDFSSSTKKLTDDMKKVMDTFKPQTNIDLSTKYQLLETQTTKLENEFEEEKYKFAVYLSFSALAEYEKLREEIETYTSKEEFEALQKRFE